MILQEWWHISQITSLPNAILQHDRYKTGKWSFDSAKAKFGKASTGMEEIIINFREVISEDGTFTSLGKIDHWKKNSSDPLDCSWTLVDSILV